jgi:hypothetical protein
MLNNVFNEDNEHDLQTNDPEKCNPENEDGKKRNGVVVDSKLCGLMDRGDSYNEFDTL